MVLCRIEDLQHVHTIKLTFEDLESVCKRILNMNHEYADELQCNYGDL